MRQEFTLSQVRFHPRFTHAPSTRKHAGSAELVTDAHDDALWFRPKANPLVVVELVRECGLTLRNLRGRRGRDSWARGQVGGGANIQDITHA
jgi:hypothetical protein